MYAFTQCAETLYSVAYCVYLNDRTDSKTNFNMEISMWPPKLVKKWRFFKNKPIYTKFCIYGFLGSLITNLKSDW